MQREFKKFLPYMMLTTTADIGRPQLHACDVDLQLSLAKLATDSSESCSSCRWLLEETVSRQLSQVNLRLPRQQFAVHAKHFFEHNWLLLSLSKQQEPIPYKGSRGLLYLIEDQNISSVPISLAHSIAEIFIPILNFFSKHYLTWHFLSHTRSVMYWTIEATVMLCNVG